MFHQNMTTDSSQTSRSLSIIQSSSYRRDSIINILKQRYIDKLQINLPIFGVERPTLKEFTTTEKDAKRGQNRYPPQQFRLKTEDLLREAETQIGKQESIENSVTVLDDYNENMQLRNQQFQASKNFETLEDDEEDEDAYETTEEPSARQSMRQGGRLIFAKKSEHVQL